MRLCRSCPARTAGSDAGCYAPKMARRTGNEVDVRDSAGVSAKVSADPHEDLPEGLAAPDDLTLQEEEEMDPLDDADLLDGDLLGDPSMYEPAEDAAAEQPGRRWLRRRYVLGVVAALVVVLVAVFGPAWWRLVTQQHASLATPDQIAGLTLNKSDDGKETADYFSTVIAASISLKSSVGAVYDDPASSQRSVMFFGGTGVLLAPDKELASAFGLLDDKSGAVRDIHSVPPGPLGGEMKCGTSTGDGGDMAVCGWADHGSIALAFFPGRTLDDAAALMRQIRDGVQHRG